MTTIISTVNNKGGVGKTTSTGIIGELLAYLGKKTLVVDLDQQSNLSMFLGSYKEDSKNIVDGIDNPSEEDENITELFRYRYRTKEDVLKVIKKTRNKNLDIIPSSKRHTNTQRNIAVNTTGNNNIILKKALDCIKDLYDYIIIDNAPASDVLTVNSMFASDYVIVPVRVEGFSYKGLKETIDTILYIKEEHDISNIEFKGAFITQAEIGTNIYKDLKESYENELGSKFLKTPIRKDIKVSEIETTFKPILEYAANSNVVFDYANLLLELDILDKTATHILRKSIGLE